MVLAEDIFSDTNIPPLDNSAMDGFCLKSADTKNSSPAAPARLKIIGTIYAGKIPRFAVGHQQAARIMTGAPIPKGVDTVIPIEEISEKDGYVFINKPVGKHNHIRNQGEDVRKNEKVILKGKAIRPAEIGMMASVGAFVII